MTTVYFGSKQTYTKLTINDYRFMKSQSIRFPDEVHAKIVQLAQEKRRSINQQVIVMLETYLGGIERQTPQENSVYPEQQERVYQ